MSSFSRDHWASLRRAEGSPFAGGCALVASELWHDRPTAEVHRFVVDHGDRRAAYYFKRYKVGGERAAREFWTLRRLADHFGDGADLGVVEPVLLLEPEGAFVTAEFAGTDARRMIRRGVRLGSSAGDRRRAERAVRSIARFLCGMQQSREPEDAEIDLEPLFGWVIDDLARCRETGMLGGATTSRVRVELSKARRRLAGRRQPIVTVNSDTKLWNFLIGEAGELRALDFVGVQPGLATEDFARIWVGLDWQRVFPDNSGARVDALQRALVDELEGYELFDAELFRVHRMCAAVRAATFASGIRRDRYRRKLRNLVGFPLIRRYYRDLIDRCARSASMPAVAVDVGVDDIARRLRVRAVDYFPELAAPETGEIEVTGRPFSEESTYPIHRFSIAAGPVEREVIVKLAPAAEVNEAVAEYTNLRRVGPALAATPHLTAPVALDMFADINAVVTRYLPHERFSSWFLARNSRLASAADVDRLKSLVARAGELLAIIHRETAEPAIAVADSQLTTRTWRYLELAFEVGLDHDVCDAVGKLLADLPPSLAGLEVPVGLAHGDYGPQNLGVIEEAGETRLAVFDLSRAHSAAVYNDIAYFLVTLETLNPFPRHPLFSRSRAMALREDFLRGYFGGPLSREQRMALHLFYVEHLVERLHKQSSNVARAASWIRDRTFAHWSVQRTYPAAIHRELLGLEELIRGG